MTLHLLVCGVRVFGPHFSGTQPLFFFCLTIHHDAVLNSHGPQEAVRMVIIVIITFTKPILCDRFHREMAHEIAKCAESSTLFILQDSTGRHREET